MSEIMDVTKIYAERFSPVERDRKAKIWQVLCEHFFQRYVQPADVVMDLGAGYCEFLRYIRCRERIAVDLNPEVHDYAPPGTRVLITPSNDLSAVPSQSVDVVFASNFFEHLPDKATFLETLWEVRRVLRVGGRLLVLQPNIRVLGGQYWDFVDHHLPLTDRTLVEALSLVNMQAQEVRPRFLPYTTKSRLPQHPLLVRVYLMLPLVHHFLGGQAWVVGVKPAHD